MEQELEAQQPELEQEQPAEIAAPVLFEDEDQESQEQEPAEGAEQPEGEPPSLKGQPAPKWVAELRKSHKEVMREKRELQRKVEELQSKLPPPVPTLGPKPTLDQFDYDEAAFGEAYDAWMQRKAAADAEDQRKVDAQRKELEEVENFKKSYADRKKSLGVDDFDEAEAEVGAILNQTQAGLLMRGADDPAVLVYALSKSPARLMDLAKITDPVKFTAAIAKMEVHLSTKKTSRPAPEPRITAERGSGFSASSNQLDKLRAEAERTGDYSRVVAYKKQMAQK
ncbi:Phage capsid and scaffold [Caballeronia glathei]|uniref:Scaffolding protein n=1 Tax=Caballeronia glathei TaxID=60547 RepID=A0A069PF65_9BURK|nr:hypothetical protein [Caballeronia glathei]KDR39200.1 hypothetical protein BG61_34165 [Caballeronia glathei]CDY76103.1 Phage capsid and scaffold [Caballeronia glathei]